MINVYLYDDIEEAGGFVSNKYFGYRYIYLQRNRHWWGYVPALVHEVTHYLLSRFGSAVLQTAFDRAWYVCFRYSSWLMD